MIAQKKQNKKKNKKKEKNSEWYRKECVKVAKKIVRLRDNNTCQRCGRNTGALHCSHVYPEGSNHGMSADPLNMKILCFQCHFLWWHKSPIEAMEWFKSEFPERLKYLKIQHRKPLKIDWPKYLESLKTQLAEYERTI